MDREKLNNLLEAHERQLLGINLRGANLSEINLSYVNLSGA